MNPDQPLTTIYPPSASLCAECRVVLLDDSASCFSPGTLDGEPTLRHVREGANLITLDPPRTWIDQLPGLPGLATSAEAGCELCGFVREALLERAAGLESSVAIVASYTWGKDRDLVGTRDDGLVLWRCEIYNNDTKDIFTLIDFAIETDNDDIMTWLRMDEKRAPHPLHPDNVEWMRAELARCEEKCSHERAYPQFLPVRLIDVGTEGEDPRLVITNDIVTPGEAHNVKYATLSYCWGSKEDALQQVKTTKTNFSMRCDGMALDAMSPVVRDAIIVCRALSFRYIWVDALCIIQGDSEDWDHESQTMSRNYYCSSLTICPLISQSCLQGFLAPRPQGLVIPFQSNVHEAIRGTYNLYLLPDIPEQYKLITHDVMSIDLRESSWSKRGWTFQEEILSLRMLYFGASMCHFACETDNISENAFFSSQTHCGPRFFMNLTLEPPPDSPGAKQIKELDVYENWAALREIMLRKWTYREDLLPGISGLAKECALATQDVYLAGLWKKHLHFNLSWEVSTPRFGDLDSTVRDIRGQDPFVAPSWSWASRETSLEELTDRRYFPDEATDHNPGKMFQEATTLPCHVRPEFELLSYEMEAWGNNPYGRLRSGFLNIAGKLAPCPSDITMNPRSSTRPASSYFAHGLGTCQLDWSVSSTATLPPGQLQLLLLSTCCTATSNWGRLQWFANPEEGHDKLIEAFREKRLVFGTGDYVDSEECVWCADKEQPRNAWGLVVCPAEEAGSYHRYFIQEDQGLPPTVPTPSFTIMNCQKSPDDEKPPKDATASADKDFQDSMLSFKKYPVNIYSSRHDAKLRTAVYKALELRKSLLFKVREPGIRSHDVYFVEVRCAKNLPKQLRCVHAFNLDEVRNHLQSTLLDPALRFAFIPRSEDGLLSCTPMMLKYLCSYLQIPPTFMQALLFSTFTTCQPPVLVKVTTLQFASEVTTSDPEKHVLRLPDKRRSGREIRLAFTLHGTENVAPIHGLDFAIRPLVAYHSFDVITGLTCFVYLKGSKVIEGLIANAVGSKEALQLPAPQNLGEALMLTLKVHMIIIDWVNKNWKAFLTSINKAVQRLEEPEHMFALAYTKKNKFNDLMLEGLRKDAEEARRYLINKIKEVGIALGLNAQVIKHIRNQYETLVSPGNILGTGVGQEQIYELAISFIKKLVAVEKSMSLRQDELRLLSQALV
ncbi:hypothetical protein G7046_g4869 [Stylonectria norvegica]|nr:hypothetical protein G7046_g4869 [Stylonectria norvegica]